MFAERLKSVEEEIRRACEKADRKREEVTLIAVSKTNPAEAVREAIEAGQLDFGENKAQEMVAKKAVCPDSARWHFIGNLQKNKVKYVVGNAVMIHSVSSIPLAAEIERIAAKKGLTVSVLAEVNIADEATKHGIGREEAVELVKAMGEMPHLHVEGLMCIAPPVEDPEENRPYFAAMRQLLNEINAMGLPGVQLHELSMGMSGDYAVAVEEGATFVRVGTALFGARNYPV
ncbi:MAG: YggS family pyridoxal phosphate-dependent enzyme [Lachnospiraceae bacterium]|nr:YggS family pyridoxal phosphate-dependent enzyme [Lachnospiraceae bacterium]